MKREMPGKKREFGRIGLKFERMEGHGGCPTATTGVVVWVCKHMMRFGHIWVLGLYHGP